MAIDSAIKRASIASIGSFYAGPSVIPTGSFSQADRQHIGYGYAGILAQESAPFTVGNANAWRMAVRAAVWRQQGRAVVWRATRR